MPHLYDTFIFLRETNKWLIGVLVILILMMRDQIHILSVRDL